MRKPPLALIAFLAVGIPLYIFLRYSDAGALHYLEDWPRALEKARASGKPILLNFSGSW